MTRSFNGSLAVLGLAIALAAMGCDVPGLSGAGAGSGSSGRPEQGSGETERMVPEYPPPLTYQMGRPSSYKITLSQGVIDFAQRPVRFRLQFAVLPMTAKVTPLVEVEKLWRKAGVRPEPFAVGNARGLVGEGRETGTLGAGTYREYAVSRKGAKALVILLVYAPKGQAITDQHRATADRLMKSVRLDEPRLSGRPRGPFVAPVVPFSYVRPPGLTGGEKVTDTQALDLEIHYGRDRHIEIRLSRAESEKSARGLYDLERNKPGGADDKIRSVKNGFGWADEGHWRRSNLWGRMVSESYHLRSGRSLVDLKALGPELGKARGTLATMARSMRLTPQG